LGGAPAWNLAVAHPEEISRLVIVNSPHPYTFWREMTKNPAQQKARSYMVALRADGAEQMLSVKSGLKFKWV
jgi:epoxide hydrolase 4